jgi:hypothetical protein
VSLDEVGPVDDELGELGEVAVAWPMKLALITTFILASGGVGYAGFCLLCPW